MLGIGDIHSGIDILDKIFEQYPDELKIFVGDSVDSFEANDTAVVSTVKTLLKSDPSKNILLVGNHELNYCGVFADEYKQKLGTPDKQKGVYCEGFRKSCFNRLYDLFNENKSRFRLAYYDEKSKTLFTHAGVIPGWIYYMKRHTKIFEMDNLIKHLCEINPFDIKDKNNPIFENGCRKMIKGKRCPPSPIAGPLWCDYNMEFQPIEFLNQVFGHTPDYKIGINRVRHPNNYVGAYLSENYMLDCLEYGSPQFLEISKEGEFRVLSPSWNIPSNESKKLKSSLEIVELFEKTGLLDKGDYKK